eukprot:gene19432-biopygen20227
MPEGGRDADGGPEEFVGVCVKWYECGYGFLWTADKPDTFVHSSGLDDIAADALKKGDEVRYIIKNSEEYGDVAMITEYIRGDVDIPEDYVPTRRPAQVPDKHTGFLYQWNYELSFGIIEQHDGETVLVTEKDLRGTMIEIGDKVAFEVEEGRSGRPKAKNITVIDHPKGKKGKKKGGKGKGGGKGKWQYSPDRKRRRRSSFSRSRPSSSGRRRRRRRNTESEQVKVNGAREQG